MTDDINTEMPESLPISSVQCLDVSDDDVLVIISNVRLSHDESSETVNIVRALLRKPELRILVLDPGVKVGKLVMLGDDEELSSAHD